MISLVGIEKTYRARGRGRSGSVKALRGVDLCIERGSAVCVIGESGCGKSTLGRILAGIEPPTKGAILEDGVDVSALSAARRRTFFRRIQLIHQDPYSALNPVRTIYDMLMDVLRLHAKRIGRDSAWCGARLSEILGLVGLDPAYVLPRYPHQLSGGMRQRIVIARALAVDPDVLVADEAVSMIDVSLRLGVLRLLRRLREELGIAVVFITHDLASARYIGHDSTVMVLYRGSVVEQGPSETVVSKAPVHPYTQALLSSIPVLRGLERRGRERVVPEGILREEDGDAGCLFAPRCPFATPECRSARPGLTPVVGAGTDSGADDSPSGDVVVCVHPKVRDVIPRRIDDVKDVRTS